jgi:hypothetical protein
MISKKVLVAFIFVPVQPNLINTLLKFDRFAVNSTELEQLRMDNLQLCPLFISETKIGNISMNNTVIKLAHP